MDVGMQGGLASKKKISPCLDWKCFEKKKKGLFGEALFLTTSHLVVLVNILLGERSEPHTGVFNRDFA